MLKKKQKKKINIFNYFEESFIIFLGPMTDRPAAEFFPFFGSQLWEEEDYGVWGTIANYLYGIAFNFRSTLNSLKSHLTSSQF